MNRIYGVRNGLVILAAVLFFYGYATAGDPDFRHKLSLIKAKNLKFYEFNRQSDLPDRIGTAPDFVLDYWSQQDGRQYAAHDLSPEERDIFRQCLADLPETYKTILKERLIGIYVVDDFLGSGLADYVLDENDRVYTILLFNPLVLQDNLTDLVTRKENTCFIPDRPDMSIAVNLDDRLPGLLYILMHEATHIVDYVNRCTPYVEPDILKIKGNFSEPRPFTDRLWADYTRFRDDCVFAYKDQVTFYGMSQGPKITISAAADVYRAMAGVPVASLYGTFNWAEDFAEYMTFRYLTKEKGTDYTITVSDKGKIVFQYQPFENEQVADRERDLPLLPGDNPVPGKIYKKSL